MLRYSCRFPLTGEGEFSAMTSTEIALLRESVARGERPRLPHGLETYVSSTHRQSQTADSALLAGSLSHTYAPARAVL